MAHETIHKTETDSQTWRTDLLLKQEGNGMGLGVIRCKLLHSEWINNKVLLYSTGNYRQSSGIDHDGKEYFRRIYIYI